MSASLEPEQREPRMVAKAECRPHPLRSQLLHLGHLFVLVVAGCALAACTSTGSAANGQRDYFPGGAPSYDWGMSQRQEDFVNVERAQAYYGLFKSQRAWENVSVGRRASATILGLGSYYRLDVRWKLKDGREFLLENIDVAAIMREYFKTHDLQSQWQREKRPRARVGDAGPMLTYDVEDDTVRLKWVITTNHTPVDQRLTPQGAATPWVTTDEEHIVTTIKGVPTQGIDFSRWFEMRS